MSEFKLPHVEDLATNSKLPGQLTENFKAIEQEINHHKKNDNYLQERCQKLEDEKATHDEVNKISQEWHDRASHIARGTDIATTRAVVMQILAEIGQVDLSKLPNLNDDIVTKKDLDKLINNLDQNGNNVSVSNSDLYSWLENYIGGGV